MPSLAPLAAPSVARCPRATHAPALAIRDALERELDPRTGFLPSRAPYAELPEPWSEISRACVELPRRYHGPDCNVRPWLHARFAERPKAWADALDTLQGTQLESLMSQCSLLCHAYRWQSAPTLPANYHLEHIALPSALDWLWTQLAIRLDIPRVGIFHTMVGHAWRAPGVASGAPYRPDDVDWSDVELLHPWLLGSHARELRAFIVAALGIEARGARIAGILRRVYTAIVDDCPARVTHELEQLHATIAGLVQHFNRHIRLAAISSHSFLTLVQPTMIWMLDEGDGPLEGASGPQCATIQLLDSALGVPRDGEFGQSLVHSRRYMMPHHRRLLARIDEQPPVLRQFVGAQAQPELSAAYDGCLDMLARWRQSHRQRGKLYLSGPEDGSVDAYVSTGLVVELESDRVQTFERIMGERHDLTRAQRGAGRCPFGHG